MAVDPVPYVVHGAKHSADVFRQTLHDSTSGAEGISLPSNLRVRQTNTPSAQVRVAPGGLLINNTYSGGAGQSYAGRVASETLVTVPASDSTGSKSWYIIFRTQDPQFGGPAPTDPLVGPYSFLECVSTSATVSDPHYRLAKVVVPASTATVTSAMITDLREMANPRIRVVNRARPSVATDTAMVLNSTTGEFFPGNAGASGGTQEIDVPVWATRMIVEAMWIGVEYSAGTNSYGKYWIEYGINADKYITQDFAFNSPGTAADGMRANWPLSDDRHVPVAMRGNTGVFSFVAKRDSPSTGRASMDRLSGLSLKVTFLEEPDQSTS